MLLSQTLSSTSANDLEQRIKWSAHSRSPINATIFAYQSRCRSNIDDDTAAGLQHASSRNIFGAENTPSRLKMCSEAINCTYAFACNC